MFWRLSVFAVSLSRAETVYSGARKGLSYAFCDRWGAPYRSAGFAQVTQNSGTLWRCVVVGIAAPALQL